jgi:hypothetical protein
MFGGDVLMPGFADVMSDTEMATLGTYLIGHFGNPAGKLTAAQVKKLRSGLARSSLIVFAQAGVGVAALVLVAIVFLLIRRWRRTPAAHAAGS